MIELRFGPGALAEVRFAISPLVELMRSVRVLHDPSGQALHLPWIVEARAALGRLDLGPRWDLQAPTRYTPDFVHPPPRTPLAELDDELDEMLATPPEQIRAEVQRTYRGQPPRRARGRAARPRARRPGGLRPPPPPPPPPPPAPSRT